MCVCIWVLYVYFQSILLWKYLLLLLGHTIPQGQSWNLSSESGGYFCLFFAIYLNVQIVRETSNMC